MLTIEVITSGSRGVFGIGAEPARVRARSQTAPAVVVPPEPEAPFQETATVAEEQTPAVVAEAPTEEEVEDPVAIAPAISAEDEAPTESEATAARNGAMLATEARHVLAQLLQTMGFDADVTVRNTESPITLAVNGDNLGVLIGRRGDNLAALQFMVNLILSKNRRQWPRVVVDVENYRARREESLRSLAERIAYRVRRNAKPFTLEAMPASDRRIIHLTLRDRNDVETYSIGEGPARRVVVAPKRGERAAVERGYSSSGYRR
jgi:spoIIIJ-associated protein